LEAEEHNALKQPIPMKKTMPYRRQTIGTHEEEEDKNAHCVSNILLKSLT
jgi:hypothetical protein